MEFLEGKYASAQTSLMAQSEKFKTDVQAAQSLDWGRSPCSKGIALCSPNLRQIDIQRVDFLGAGIANREP
jgi:hypothetical protein